MDIPMILSEYFDRGRFSLKELHLFFKKRSLHVDLSTLSKIKSGKRRVNDRASLLVLIEFFLAKKIITTKTEANLLSEASGFGFLSKKELSLVGLSDYSLTSEMIYGLNKSFTNEDYTEVTEIWQLLGPRLWDTGEWKKMKQLSKKVEESFKSANRPYEYCNFQNEIAWMNFWMGDLQSAEAASNKAHQISLNKHQENCASVRRGKVLQALGDFQGAVSVFNDCMEYYRSIHDDYMVCHCYMYLGETYWIGGDIVEAIRNLTQAESIAIKHNDMPRLAIILTRIGGIYAQAGQFLKAENAFDRSNQVEAEAGRRFGGLFWNNLGKGFIYNSLRDDAKSREFYSEARSEFEHLGMDSSVQKTGTFLLGMRNELKADKNFHEMMGM